MRYQIKPVSVNECYSGRRRKTDKYRVFARHLGFMLKPVKVDFTKPLRIDFTFGFSSHGSDIDNCLKTSIDVLQSKYKFNDNRIYELNAKKEIVSKGKEFIEFEILELNKKQN